MRFSVDPSGGHAISAPATGTKDRVIGSDLHEQGVTHRMSDAADGAVNAVQEASDRLEHATHGNRSREA